MNSIVLMCVLSAVLAGAAAIQDYCSMHNFITNGTQMQFTKEPSVEEFAIVGKFKGLHCCAKGYRSIEWYKDGKPQPWSLSVSQFILYPESANQTVYAQGVTADDAGNYTCLLRNDSVVHAHTIQLVVFENTPDDPQITYVSPDTEVALGHSLRLFCEAFAGQVDLPDAYSEVVWRKLGDENRNTTNTTTFEKDPRVRQQKVSREEGQTFGTYLIINDIKEDDFAEYVCRMSKPGKTIERHVYVREKVEVKYLKPTPVPFFKLSMLMVGILFFAASAIILNVNYGLPFRVRMKDNFGLREIDDGRVNDILVVHSPKDSELVQGVLVSTLQTKYGYKCLTKELSFDMSSWYSSLEQEANISRRIIAVLSPALFGDNWSCSPLYDALKIFQELHCKIIGISLKRLPDSRKDQKNSMGANLCAINGTVKVLNWERSSDERFWLALRLRLPPMRGNALETNSQGGNSSRLTSDSQETFDSFV